MIPKFLKHPKIVTTLILSFCSGCAINFEITSQRTALENQMLGTYGDMSSELYLISSVRSLEAQASEKQDATQILKMARQNQIYNRDDIDELKDKQVLGEDFEGNLTLIASGFGLVAKATPEQLQLAKLLVAEENHDRSIIWQHTISSNDNLKASDLTSIRETFASQIFNQAKAGHWFLTKSNGWQQKSVELKQDNTKGN